MIAGITAWPARAELPASIGPRKDEALVNAFACAGVPEGHSIFLRDAEATAEGIGQALSAMTRRSGPGDTVFFCFLGHGGPGVLYPYDYDESAPIASALPMSDLTSALTKLAPETRLLLIGDFCGSGSLGSTLSAFETMRPDVRVAVLASAMGSCESSAHWTFTEGLISILMGDRQVDSDGDDVISLADAAVFLRAHMKKRELQLATVQLSSNFESSFVLRRVAAGAGPAISRLHTGLDGHKSGPQSSR